MPVVGVADTSNKSFTTCADMGSEDPLSENTEFNQVLNKDIYLSALSNFLIM